MPYLLAPANGAIHTQLTNLAPDADNGGNWTPHPDFIGTLRIGDAIDRCFSNTLDNDEALYYSNAPDTADFDARLYFGRWGSGAIDNFIGFCYRVQLDGKSFYRVRYNGTDWLLERVIDGVAVTLGSVPSVDPPVSLGAAVVVDVHVEGRNHFVWITDSTGSISRFTIFAVDSTLLEAGRFGIWGSCGGASTGTAGTHVPANGMILSYGPGLLLVSPNSMVASPPALDFDITVGEEQGSSVVIGGLVIGGEAPVAVSYGFLHGGGVRIGGSAGGNMYIIADDNIPNGGVVVRGEARVAEAINLRPEGGVVIGGEGVVQERITFFASGGVILAGTSDVAYSIYPVIPAGGVLCGGSALVASVSVVQVGGGVVIGGESPLDFKYPFFQPSGGVIIGGAAFVAANVTDIWTALAMNMEAYGISRYTNMPANSIVQFQGRPYVANGGGIYLMDADDDAGVPIDASVEIGETDFATSREKRMEIAYLGIKTTGRMKLMVRVNGRDPQYYAVMPPSETAKGTVVRIGKGLKGRYWGMRIDNVDGGDFEMESVEFLPHEGQRRGA